MITRIAILAASLIAAGAAQAQSSAAPSGAASSLQGQKAWDFLAASPSASQREVPTTGSVAQRPRRAADRAQR